MYRTIHHHISFLGVSALLFFAVAGVHAEENGTTTQEAQPSAQTIPVQSTEANQPVSEKPFTQAVQDRIINLVRNVIARIQASEERLQAISTRVESRIGKMKAGGADVHIAEQKLIDAKNDLATAHTMIGQLSTIDTVIRSDTPRQSYTVFRTQLYTTSDTLLRAYASLVDALRIMQATALTPTTSVSQATTTQNATNTNPNSR